MYIDGAAAGGVLPLKNRPVTTGAAPYIIYNNRGGGEELRFCNKTFLCYGYVTKRLGVLTNGKKCFTIAPDDDGEALSRCQSKF